LTPYESAATGKKISELLAGKEGPRNAAHLDSFMQGKMNPLASEIIKSCLPNGLAVPFPANVSNVCQILIRELLPHISTKLK